MNISNDVNNRVPTQPDCSEGVNSGKKGSDVDDRTEMKELESGSAAPDINGPTQTIETKVEEVVPVRPPLNTPFLRSSVKRKKKESNPPPPAPKPEETEKVEVKPDRKRCWEAWSDGETTLFFEAVNEYGKDFDAIQKYIEQRHKKLGLAAHQVKNKNQVRHLYYRTCHKLFSFINLKPDQEKTASELFALVNFGELRKKLNLKGGITRRVGQRLNQLVNTGQTVIRVRGMNRRVKTPLCKTLRKITGDENKSDPYKLPAHVLMELQPKNNQAWASVQGAAHNPRVRLVVSLKKNLGSIISYLNEKWTPHRSKLLNTLKPTATKQDALHLRLVLSEGVEVTPHRQLTGRYMHSDSRAVFSLESEARVTKAVAASKAAKIQKAAISRAPSGSSLDCTKDVPGLDQKCGNDGTGKQQRKYKPRKKAKLSKECPRDTEQDTIIVSNHRRKSDDSEAMDLGKSDSSKSSVNMQVETHETHTDTVEETIPLEEMKWTVAPEKELTKDQQLLGLLSAENSKNLSMTDIYIMLNMPTRFKFEYEFVNADESDSSRDSPTKSKLLNKLYELASTEFTDIKKPRRSVSVGTVTSPQRFNNISGTNTTPPSKASFISQLSRSPSNTRGNRNTVTNGLGRANSRPAPKPSSCGGRDKDNGVFLTPAAPSPQPNRLAVESSTAAAEKLFMAQIESLQKQPTFLQPKNRRGRKPLVVQRTLLPRPQSEHKGPTREMMSMSKTGQFTPVQLGIPDSVKQRSIVRPVPILPGVQASDSSRQPGQSNIPLVSTADSTIVSYALSPVTSNNQAVIVSPMNVSSPITCLAIPSPTSMMQGGTSPMNEIEAASAAAGIDTTLIPSPPDQAPFHTSPIPMATVPPLMRSPMLNPSPQIIDDTMEIVSVTQKNSSNSYGSSETNVAELGGGDVQTYRISPPNLSSLLEISLPSSAAAGTGGDAMMDIPIGTESFTGFSQHLSPTTNNSSVMLPSMSPVHESGNTTPPLHMSSPSSSPFKLSSLGLDGQWLNGEAADIHVSLSSILANLESPEKKECQSIINSSSSSSSLSIPLVNIINESSRDSTISRDVDTHLQYMMNENSVDYVAKFADLAAHITAQQEAQKEATVRH